MMIENNRCLPIRQIEYLWCSSKIQDKVSSPYQTFSLTDIDKILYISYLNTNSPILLSCKKILETFFVYLVFCSTFAREKVKNEEWRVKSEEWKVKSEKWRVKSEEWRVKPSEWAWVYGEEWVTVHWPLFTDLCSLTSVHWQPTTNDWDNGDNTTRFRLFFAIWV